MNVISRTATYHFSNQQRPRPARSFWSVFFNICAVAILIVMSAKLLSWMETSLSQSIQPATAATEAHSTYDLYRYYNVSEDGYIQPVDSLHPDLNG
ncbi:MAG: hypothetical protein NUV82_03985 [Candidatus Komeilibacteria bacterium]|nr:hypothetical protein [Candidatus Komeilibacteria bacterium]